MSVSHGITGALQVYTLAWPAEISLCIPIFYIFLCLHKEEIVVLIVLSDSCKISR